MKRNRNALICTEGDWKFTELFYSNRKFPYGTCTGTRISCKDKRVCSMQQSQTEKVGQAKTLFVNLCMLFHGILYLCLLAVFEGATKAIEASIANATPSSGSCDKDLVPFRSVLGWFLQRSKGIKYGQDSMGGCSKWWAEMMLNIVNFLRGLLRPP